MTDVLDPVDLKSEICRRAKDLGFVRVGVAAAGPLDEEGAKLRAWLADGCHGDMDYMQDTVDVRVDPSHEGMLPSVASVLVLVTPYGASDPCLAEPGRMARYARNRDYHNVLHKRLRKLTGFLRAQGHTARAAVDSMPVFERAWAARAGVGFIGKNCCLIVPGLGSHVFLSALVTSAPLAADTPMANRCGDCTACLQGCPTDAFAGANRLDARRCLSYLTIEQRGPIEPSLRPAVGAWIFGCDACQDVCPFNRARQAQVTDSAFAEPRFSLDAQAFLEMDSAEFQAATLGSPLRRAGRDGLARNAAIVLGNVGTRRHLPVLSRVARTDPSSVVREAAGWAASALASRCVDGPDGMDESNSEKG